tara:strand:- start:3506 stop:4198 length:693 start_codon:yes stop_codon:yes gene_type:complete
MVMDKGLSLNQAKNLISSSSDQIDLIKLGFGTSIVTPNLVEKIDLYQKQNIKVFFGGTLFESFIARNSFNEYTELIKKFNIKTVEISDGCIDLDHNVKCNFISKLSKSCTVLSEVGSKDEEVELTSQKWIELLNRELNAGSWKVITESRESGNIGLFKNDHKVKSNLIQNIINNVPKDSILWEAPKKIQQVWFIKSLGPNVNLGNISPDEVISLECLRLGLRADTFFDFL